MSWDGWAARAYFIRKASASKALMDSGLAFRGLVLGRYEWCSWGSGTDLPRPREPQLVDLSEAECSGPEDPRRVLCLSQQNWSLLNFCKYANTNTCSAPLQNTDIQGVNIFLVVVSSRCTTIKVRCLRVGSESWRKEWALVSSISPSPATAWPTVIRSYPLSL